MQIANARGVYARQSASAQVKHVPALRMSRNVERYRGTYSRHLDVCAKHQLCIRDEDFAVQIFAIPLEPLVFLDLEYNEDVTASASTRPDVARAPHRHVLARRHSRRDLDHNILFLAHPAFTPALLAGRRDDGPFT